MVAAAVAVALIGSVVAVIVLLQPKSADVEAGAGPGPDFPASASASASASVPTDAPASPATTPPTGPALTEAVFTGHSSDKKLALAVGIKDGRAAGYLCDGKDVEAWLEGTVTGDQLSLQDRTAGTTVTATIKQRSLLGYFTVNGVVDPFAAEIAATRAGLYENRRTVEGITTRIGWIVLPDGSQVGIRTEKGFSTPAPPLDVDTLQAADNGQTVQAERLSGASIVILR